MKRWIGDNLSAPAENLIIGALAAAVIGVLLVSYLRADPPPVPRCYEDEVLVWTGRDHDKCVPIDNLIEAEEATRR